MRIYDASKKAYTYREQLYIMGVEQWERAYDYFLKNSKLQNGNAIAVGTLIDCRLMTEYDEDKCFVKYQQGLYCHVYENIRPIKPIPYKGAQGWRKLPESFWDLIEFVPKSVTPPTKNKSV